MTRDDVTERRRASVFTPVRNLWISVNFDIREVSSWNRVKAWPLRRPWGGAHNFPGDRLSRVAYKMRVGIGSFAGKLHIHASVMGLVLVGIIWELAAWIVAGAARNPLSLGTGLVACAIILHILTDWRSGVVLFLI